VSIRVYRKQFLRLLGLGGGPAVNPDSAGTPKKAVAAAPGSSSCRSGPGGSSPIGDNFCGSGHEDMTGTIVVRD